MIDSVQINCDRCIAIMIMMMITFKRHEYNDFKRYKYDNDLNDFNENFEDN